MKKGLLVLMMICCLMPDILWSADIRGLKEKPDTKCLKVTFNGETISAYYLLIDARSTAEKEADAERGCLGGSVMVFLQGHGQRPGDAYKFTSKLALGSKSGMVVIPVADTPYGDDPAWRGDRGKDVVLMEIVRSILSGQGIIIEGYKKLTDVPITINGRPVSAPEKGVRTKLASIGWSHGGILSRRMAAAYPESFTSLGQVCPAGYKHWSCTGSLIGRFSWEGLHISTLMVRGHAMDTLGCGWGLTRGIVGDFGRSFPRAVVDLQISKLGRSWRDVKDCCLYCDDTNFPLPGIQNIVVAFGRDDYCISHADYGLNDPDAVTAETAAVFWRTYYPSALAAGAKLDLRILPGMHVGPVTDSEEYSQVILAGIDQLRVAPASQGDVKP